EGQPDAGADQVGRPEPAPAKSFHEGLAREQESMIMGTLRGFPNPPATGPAGRSPSGSHAMIMGTLRGFPNPPATGPAGRSPSGSHASIVRRLFGAAL